jgi:hypothetical protein
MKVDIDRWGFLRYDGKIVGWTPYDFLWARGWLPRRVKSTPQQTPRSAAASPPSA